MQKPKFSHEERLRIWETSYGRDAGRLLERHGETVALLTEPEWDEMFWISYRITLLTQNQELRQLMHTRAFWHDVPNLTWRSRAFGVIAPNAFAGASTCLDTDRISMRGLLIDIEEPRLWDRAVLWWRKRRQG
jgi:hypothetical protein